MSIQNGTRIVSPINLQEPYTVMGVSKTGTYYDLAYICSNSHGEINIWARNKPVRVNTPATLTDAQINAAFSGLNLYIGATPESMVQNSLAGNKWTYLPPRPGTDWCRLTDWNGYSHNAQPQFRVDKLDDEVSAKTPTGWIYAEIKWYEVDSYSVEIENFTIDGTPLKEYYICIIIVDSNGRLIRGMCGGKFNVKANKWNEKRAFVPVRVQNEYLAPGNYKMIPVLSSVKRDNVLFTAGQNWSGGKYVSLPLSFGTLNVVNINLQVLAYFLHENGGSTKTAIRVFLYYTNEDNTSYRGEDISIYACREARDYPGLYDRYYEEKKIFIFEPNKSNILESQGVIKISEDMLEGIQGFGSETWYIEIEPPKGSPIGSLVAQVLMQKPGYECPFRDEYGNIPSEWNTDK